MNFTFRGVARREDAASTAWMYGILEDYMYMYSFLGVALYQTSQ